MAGTGAVGFTRHSVPAKEAPLSGPKGIAIDREGNVWLADTESHSVRMIDARTGRLELIAGTGEKGDGPDGDPLQCALNRLHGIYVDSDGSILIGDSEAHRIRVLRRTHREEKPRIDTNEHEFRGAEGKRSASTVVYASAPKPSPPGGVSLFRAKALHRRQRRRC
jgi:streptogramin lyase